MKLRNKTTGKIVECECITIFEPIYDKVLGKSIDEFYTISELNAEWEDYESQEPLIKDEKIRKAVRAWAEADDLDNFRVQNQHFNECKINGYTAGTNKSSFICFQTTIARADSKKLYTIAELCGEEECSE